MTIAHSWAHAFQDGSLIPDWVYGENNGYGAVTVRFYPPLAHITLAFFEILFGTWSSAVLNAFVFWSAIGCIGVYLWTKDVVDSRKAAVAAATVFAFTPYHVNQFYHGFFWGEFVSLCVAPFCFYFVRRLQIGPSFLNCLGLCGFLALLILSNIPQLIVTGVCLGIYFLLLVDRQTILRSLGYVTVAVIASLTLTAFFWVRLLVEISWIKIGQPSTDPLYDYRNNFLLTQLRLTEGGNDLAMLFFGTYFLILMIALVTVAIFVSGKFPLIRTNKQYRSIALVFLIAAFLTTFTSQFVWDAMPLLNRIQFPWRFLSMASLCFAVLMGLALNSISLESWRRRRPVVLVLTGLVLILLTFSIKQDILAAAYVDSATFEQEVVQSFERVGLEHWHPLWTTRATFETRNYIVSPNGREAALRRSSTNGYEFSVGPGPSEEIRLPITYYPHWKLKINGEPAPIFQSGGALAFNISESPSEVTLRFVEPTYSVGSRWVSLVTFVMFLCTAVFCMSRSIPREEQLA